MEGKEVWDIQEHWRENSTQQRCPKTCEWLKSSGNYIHFFNKVGRVLDHEPSEARAKGLL